MIQYEDWQFHPSRLPKQFSEERKKFIEQIENDFLLELQQNPKVIDYLKGYSEDSAQSFLKHYATWKRILVDGSEHRMREIEKGPELRYREETEDVYEAILQKKLFNLELLWRANQVTIPGISITMDFFHWEQNVCDCPFIDPVTFREIELMQQFLKSDQCSLARRGRILSEFSFDEILEQNDEGDFENMPEWFTYYDTYIGTGHLLLLPNTRGDQEEAYRELYFEESRAKQAAEEAANPRPPHVASLPYLSTFSEEERYKFSKVADDEIFQQLFLHEKEEAAAKRKAEDAAGIYDIEDIVYNLDNIPDPPPVRGGVSWREALWHCWQEYLANAICDDLPLLWEERKFLQEAGLISLGEKDRDIDRLSERVKEQILRGRELAGEPRDLNF